MAKHNTKSAAPHAGDDSVVYKVMAAILVAVIAVTVLIRVKAFYSTAGGLSIVSAGLVWGIWISLALAVICAAAAVLLRSRKTLCYTLVFAGAAFVLALVSCVLLRTYWVTVAAGCYYLWIAAALLYSIYLLYQREFFFVALVTAVAGGTFYCTSHAYGSAASILCVVLLVCLSVLTAALTFKLAKSEGKLSVGKKAVQLFSPNFSAFPLYIVSVLWALCAVAVLVLGSAFAYYCMYAAVGVSLVAVCYYTIKLM